MFFSCFQKATSDKNVCDAFFPQNRQKQGYKSDPTEFRISQVAE